MGKISVKKELYVLGLIFFTLVVIWNVYDYKNSIVNNLKPTDALAASQSRVASLSVTVAQSITLTQVIGNSINFGTLTPGTPVTGKTGLQVTTNGTGMNITAGRQRSQANVTLASSANSSLPGNQICDQKSGCASGTIAGNVTPWNQLTGCTSGLWNGASSLGFGFSLYGFTGGNAKNTSCWGSGASSTDSNNRYAALLASASATSIISSSGYSASPSITSVGYKLDVSSSQKATSYSGGVVFTATSTP